MHPTVAKLRAPLTQTEDNWWLNTALQYIDAIHASLLEAGPTPSVQDLLSATYLSITASDQPQTYHELLQPNILDVPVQFWDHIFTSPELLTHVQRVQQLKTQLEPKTACILAVVVRNYQELNLT